MVGAEIRYHLIATPNLVVREVAEATTKCIKEVLKGMIHWQPTSRASYNYSLVLVHISSFCNPLADSESKLAELRLSLELDARRPLPKIVRRVDNHSNGCSKLGQDEDMKVDCIEFEHKLRISDVFPQEEIKNEMPGAIDPLDDTVLSNGPDIAILFRDNRYITLSLSRPVTPPPGTAMNTLPTWVTLPSSPSTPSGEFSPAVNR